MVFPDHTHLLFDISECNRVKVQQVLGLHHIQDSLKKSLKHRVALKGLEKHSKALKKYSVYFLLVIEMDP